MKICRVFTFDSAHYLPRHEGKCRNLHGHTYRLEIELEDDPDLISGMILDFGDLKEIVTPTIERLDHHLLNEIIPTPTAENIARYFYEDLKGKLPMISRIRVWETPTSYAEVNL